MPSAASRAAVETARYQLHQACLRRLPAPPSAARLPGLGGESLEHDLADVAREFIRRAELCVAARPRSLSPYYARFSRQGNDSGNVRIVATSALGREPTQAERHGMEVFTFMTVHPPF